MTSAQNLMGRALNAAVWGYAGTFIKLVMQVGVQIVLARLLGPGEYGLFAIGVMVISFAMYFCDVTSSALIARKTLIDLEIRFAFTWQIIVSLIVTVLLIIFAQLISTFVKKPEAEEVIKLLGVVCVFNAIGGVALALLRHNLNFKVIQLAQIAGYFVGYVLVALPYALFISANVNAVILAWIVQVLVTSIIYFYFAPHSLKPCFSCDSAKDLIGFGRNSLVSNLGSWALINADKIVIARFFSVAIVGVYSTASNLMSTPLSLIYATFQQVTFSASAKLSTEESVGRLFATITSVVFVFAGLAYGFSLIAADAIVVLLYGEKWKAAVPFIQAFSVTMFFHAISGVVTPLLWAHGAISKDAKIQIGMGAVVAVGALMMVSWSAIAVAWCVAGIFGLRSLLLLWTGIRVFPSSRSLLAEALSRSAVFLLGAGALMLSVNYILGSIGGGVAIRFLFDLFAVVVCAILLIKFRHLMGKVFFESIEMMVSKIPSRARQLLNFLS